MITARVMNDAEDLKKVIQNNCPRCGGETKSYFTVPFFSAVKAYCPECDIVGSSWSSPYLCKTCHSQVSYNPDRRKEFKMLNIKYELKKQLAEAEKKGCKESEREVLREQIKKVEEKTPKNRCWVCNGTDFFVPSVDGKNPKESFEELKKNGYILPTNELSLIPAPVPKCVNGDEHRYSGILTRHNSNVFRIGCKKCLLDFYVEVPTWQQNKIGDAATVEELVKLENCKVMEVEDASNMAEINRLIEREKGVLKKEAEVNELIAQKAYQL